jgi:predicted acylesterase/phospholipase RssA
VTNVSEDFGFEYCDLVMKGGITSGVVYPLAIEVLSNKFFFKNIGGTSAGAIAAVITAAAEYGRRSGHSSSYDVVKNLPDELRTNGRLLKLFQPSRGTTKTFRVALTALRFKSITGRWFGSLAALIWNFLGWALLGALIGGAAPLFLFKCFRGPVTPYLVLGLLWVTVFSGLFLMLAAVKNAVDCTSANGFGFCTGFASTSKSDPPLTNWLHERIQSAAGKNSAAPVTFGDLWGAPMLKGEQLTTLRAINLEVVTTNLTLGRPYTIPFESHQFYFDQTEFAVLFPEPVVKWLVEHPHQGHSGVVHSREGKPLHPLPDGRDLPLLVAARMSLSFPILLSAIPLYKVDYLSVTSASPEDTEGVVSPRAVTETKGLNVEQRTADRCWFSDGGICSNFPIHFFDSPLPRWPTFGIDLEPASPSKKRDRTDEDLVWFPQKPGAGSQLPIDNFDQGTSSERLVGFFGAIVNTMQNWRDNIQAIAAGYRDRIVHISLMAGEGGLNLNMKPDLISHLSNRGRIAGELLCKYFDFDSHYYARYRITMCGIQDHLTNLHNTGLTPLTKTPSDETTSKVQLNHCTTGHGLKSCGKLFTKPYRISWHSFHSGEQSFDLGRRSARTMAPDRNQSYILSQNSRGWSR